MRANLDGSSPYTQTSSMESVRSVVLAEPSSSPSACRPPRKIAWDELQAGLAERRKTPSNSQVSWRELQGMINSSEESDSGSPGPIKPAPDSVFDDVEKPLKKQKKKEKKNSEKKSPRGSVMVDEAPARTTHIALAHMLLAAAAPLGVGREELQTVKGQLQLIGHYDGLTKKKGKAR